ncbi:MAG: hypothetical protein D3906_13095 [Candidatus Electrothrix sp. AUS1_2]|nr:hypothetical protein [Candidatus Electrothrix sp. AUS1_2]
MLEVLLRYVVRATKKIDEDAVREVLDRSGVGEDFMQNFIDKYIELGRNQGISRGQLEGLREAVMDILEVRFGQLTAVIQEKVNSCTDLRKLKKVLRQAVLIGSPEELDL